MQCSALYAGVQRRPRRLYTGMSTADVPMCADVVFVVTLQRPSETFVYIFLFLLLKSYVARFSLILATVQ